MSLPIAPSQTLYLNNLNDKISIPELKREIYCLFSSVAPVVEIEARKGSKTRGQAWVSFSSVEIANVVMQRLQGFNLLGKDLHIEYAKNNSKVIAEFYQPRGETEEQQPEPEPETKETNRILKVTGYPPKADSRLLSVIFRQTPGFQKTEMMDGFAHVYYNDETQAADALNKFNSFKIVDGYNLKIEFL